MNKLPMIQMKWFFNIKSNFTSCWKCIEIIHTIGFSDSLPKRKLHYNLMQCFYFVTHTIRYAALNEWLLFEYTLYWTAGTGGITNQAGYRARDMAKRQKRLLSHSDIPNTSRWSMRNDTALSNTARHWYKAWF